MRGRSISVEHSTVYRYNSAVHLEPHTFRLRPRMTTTQLLLSFDLRIVPAPAGATESLDQDGNLALHAWFNTPAFELNVTSRYRVELLRDNPFDFTLPTGSQRLPLWYTPTLAESLSAYRNDLNVSDPVKQYAKSLAADAQWDVMSFLTALNRHIFYNFQHVTRPEGPARPSDETLNLRQGSCRDLAVLFCDVCRVMGVAARFVSGYECASAGQHDSSMHAWAEVYLPAAGWRGYDPSRGLAVADGHVAVAAAFDADLAAPISGLFQGACESQMETRLYMQVDSV